MGNYNVAFRSLIAKGNINIIIRIISHITSYHHVKIMINLHLIKTHPRTRVTDSIQDISLFRNCHPRSLKFFRDGASYHVL